MKLAWFWIDLLFILVCFLFFFFMRHVSHPFIVGCLFIPSRDEQKTRKPQQVVEQKKKRKKKKKQKAKALLFLYTYNAQALPLQHTTENELINRKGSFTRRTSSSHVTHKTTQVDMEACLEATLCRLSSTKWTQREKKSKKKKLLHQIANQNNKMWNEKRTVITHTHTYEKKKKFHNTSNSKKGTFSFRYALWFVCNGETRNELLSMWMKLE